MVITDQDLQRIRERAETGKKEASLSRQLGESVRANLMHNLIWQCRGGMSAASKPSGQFLAVCFGPEEEAGHWPFMEALSAFSSALASPLRKQAETGIQMLFEARLIGSLARCMLYNNYIHREDTLLTMLAQAERQAGHYGVALNLTTAMRDAIYVAAERKERTMRPNS